MASIGSRVEGIGGGDHQRVALLGERNDAVAHQEAELQAIGQQRHLGEILRIGESDAEELGQQPGHVGLRHQPEPGQHQVEALARLALRALRPVHGQFVERALLEQELAQLFDEGFAARI